MNSFVFQNSTKVYFGNDSVSTYLPGLLAQYGPKVMLTYGGGSIKKTGIYEEIMGYLKTAGKTVVEFSGIRSNPTYAKVLEGAALAKKRKGGPHSGCRRRQRHGLLQSHFSWCRL